MLGYVEILHIYLFKQFFQGKETERPAKAKLMPAKLHAVLATLGFWKNVRKYFKKSACGPKICWTPCNVSLH